MITPCSTALWSPPGSSCSDRSGKERIIKPVSLPEQETIMILLNGKEEALPAGVRVADLLRIFKIPERGIAIEVNRHIVPRGRWEEVILNPGDRVEIVQMMGGG